jgi:hypothetical protein
MTVVSSVATNTILVDSLTGQLRGSRRVNCGGFAVGMGLISPSPHSVTETTRTARH